jgi:hypothetical protein
MNGQRVPPAGRLYVLVAAKADVALVLRRGPSDWWHLLHWDLAGLTLTPGAWFHGDLYARRCDISPDGRLYPFCAHNAGPTFREKVEKKYSTPLDRQPELLKLLNIA